MRELTSTVKVQTVRIASKCRETQTDPPAPALHPGTQYPSMSLVSTTTKSCQTDSSGPDLCVVATLSEDTQHIDVEECERRKIQVLRCPPADLVAKADLTVALILLTMRNQCANIPMDNRPHISTCDLFTLPGKASDVTSALWNNVTRRKTFGVYGMTSLGLAVTAKLRNLGAIDVMVTDFDQGVEEVENRLVDLDLKDFEVAKRENFLERADIVCAFNFRASTQNEALLTP